MTHLNHSIFSSLLWRGSRARVVLLALSLLLAGRATALDPIKTYPTLMLKDGRRLSTVEVISYTTTGLLVRHSEGGTSLRTDVLPEQVIAELHLSVPQAARLLAYDPAFLALADKAALPDKVDLADKVALADTVAALSSGDPAANHDSRASLESAQATAFTSAADATLAPAGEGELSTAGAGGAKPVVLGARSKWITFAGRVAVALPTGEFHLLGDVEVRAYPADLLARYLGQARAKSADWAKQLRDQAVLAAQEGRVADCAALVARATKTAEHYLDLLPEAPYVARSDPYGYFTLRHDLPDIRLVAVGRVRVPRGEWTYAWIGVTLGEDSLLTEANATIVSAPTPNSSQLAAR